MRGTVAKRLFKEAEKTKLKDGGTLKNRKSLVRNIFGKVIGRRLVSGTFISGARSRAYKKLKREYVRTKNANKS